MVKKKLMPSFKQGNLQDNIDVLDITCTELADT